MIRLSILVIALMLSGGVQAAAPAFDTEHFCAGFAETHASANMGDMARAVCLLSEQFDQDHRRQGMEPRLGGWPGGLSQGGGGILCEPRALPEFAAGAVTRPSVGQARAPASAHTPLIPAQAGIQTLSVALDARWSLSPRRRGRP